MLDFYNLVEGNPNFRQFKVNELLFTAYDCPLEESPLDYWVEKNYFCYVIRGGAKWKTPTDEYILQAGDAAFIKRGAHRIFKLLTGEFCGLLVFTPDNFIRSVIKKNKLQNLMNFKVKQPDSVIPLKIDRKLHDYFITLLNYFNDAQPPSKSLLDLKFKELIVHLSSSKDNDEIKTFFRDLNYNTKTPIKSVMDEHFIFNLSLNDFAILSDRSLSSFKRDFAKIYKTSPGKWLINKRLAYSKYLLETSSLNVTEIYNESGFKNLSHFIKVFKNKYGTSPAQYKRLVLEDSE